MGLFGTSTQETRPNLSLHIAHGCFQFVSRCILNFSPCGRSVFVPCEEKYKTLICHIERTLVYHMNRNIYTCQLQREGHRDALGAHPAVATTCRLRKHTTDLNTSYTVTHAHTHTHHLPLPHTEHTHLHAHMCKCTHSGEKREEAPFKRSLALVTGLRKETCANITYVYLLRGGEDS